MMKLKSIAYCLAPVQLEADGSLTHVSSYAIYFANILR